jgi:ABC-type lipoprotein export system ATPase subunit
MSSNVKGIVSMVNLKYTNDASDDSSSFDLKKLALDLPKSTDDLGVNYSSVNNDVIDSIKKTCIFLSGGTEQQKLEAECDTSFYETRYQRSDEQVVNDIIEDREARSKLTGYGGETLDEMIVNDKVNTVVLSKAEEELLVKSKKEEVEKVLNFASPMFSAEELEEAMQKVMDAYAGGIGTNYQFNEKQLTLFRRNNIGFIFQFYNLMPNLTAKENIELATEISDKPLSIEAVLDRVGLKERMDHFPSQMSGGEQQRVAIARAIAKNPDVLLCDEPTGALDYTTGKLVLNLLRDINKETGKTVIIITHNQPIASIAMRVIKMRSGEIVENYINDNPVDPEMIEW